VKTGGHDADDRIGSPERDTAGHARIAAERDGLTDGISTRGEIAAPHLVAQNHDVRAVAIFVVRETPAEHRLHAEHFEDAAGDSAANDDVCVAGAQKRHDPGRGRCQVREKARLRTRVEDIVHEQARDAHRTARRRLFGGDVLVYAH